MSLSIRREELLPGRNYIGRWCDAEEGRRFDVTDPATDAVVASVPVAAHCLYVAGFMATDARVLVHSVAGTFFYGVFGRAGA